MKRIGRLEGLQRGRQHIQADNAVLFLDGAQCVGEVAAELLAVNSPSHPSSSINVTPSGKRLFGLQTLGPRRFQVRAMLTRSFRRPSSASQSEEDPLPL
jgi:hypothetical protein